jgi:hypothetical protein
VRKLEDDLMNENSRFRGSGQLLLQEYFDLKVRLSELQTMKRFNNSEKLSADIVKVEVSIVEILSMFDKGQLLQIIYMGLDIDYENLTNKGSIIIEK